jgi:hypothetical protein
MKLMPSCLMEFGKELFGNATENIERVDERKSLLRHTLTKFHLSSYRWEPL